MQIKKRNFHEKINKCKHMENRHRQADRQVDNHTDGQTEKKTKRQA